MSEIVIGDEEETTAVATRRPSGFNAKLAEKVLTMVADGATLREIAADPEMPTKSTIQRWIMKYPELAQAWKAARELSASTLEDEALDMARTLKSKTAAEFTGTRVRAFEVAMNQFRWSASHRDPAQYGQTSTPNIVVPVQINTSLDLGQVGVKSEVRAFNSYEVAAKINKEYSETENGPVQGHDDQVEQAEGEPRAGGAYEGTPFDISEKPETLAIKPRKPLGRPKMGRRKTPAKTKESATRYAKKGLGTKND